jgi:predicted Zn-dependent protease
VRTRRTALALAAALLASPACRTAQQAEQEDFDRTVVARVRAEKTIVADAAVSDYVRGVARPIAAARGARSVRYRVIVLADASDRSFSVGGGYVFVHTGALEAASGTPEVAAMLAHELAHLALGHELLARERDRAAHGKGSKEERGMRSLGSSREDVTRAIFAHRQWTLDQEQEADRLAVQLLAEADACPAALGALLRRRADDVRTPASGALPAPGDTQGPHAPRIGRRSRTEERLEALVPELARSGPCAPSAGTDPLAAVQEILRRADRR